MKTKTSKTTIATIAKDKVINAAESAAGVIVTGTNELGAKVTLNGLVTTATSPTSWKYTLTDAQIKEFGQGSEVLKAVSTDKAGKVLSTDTQKIKIDTNAPKATEVYKVAKDNFINATERDAGVEISGKNEAGATVTVNGLKTNSLSATKWNITLTSEQLKAMGQGEKTLNIVTTDAAGNATQSTQIITIDTLAPKAAVVDKVAIDDIINTTESAAGVTIKGTVETADDKVFINDLPAKADSGTTWSITLTPKQIKAFGEGAETLQITTADSAGNVTKSTKNITVDTQAQAAVVDKVATDNIINAAESKAGVTISGTNEKGSTVTLNNLPTKVLSPTSWNLVLSDEQIKALGEGPEKLNIVTTDAMGNTIKSTQAITIDTLAPKATVVNKVATDNIINAAESKAGVTITGTNEADATVTMNGLSTKAVSPTSWNFTLTEEQIKAFGQGSETLNLVTTDAAGNTTPSSQDISVQLEPPLKLKTSAGDAINKIQLSVTNDSASAEPHDLKFSGLAQGVTILDANGQNVTGGVSGFLGSAVYTVVLPEKTDSHFNLTVLQGANNTTATTDNTVKIALDSTSQNNDLNFASSKQNIWATGDSTVLGFHQYIPLIGTETTPWTQSLNLVDISIANKYDFGSSDLLAPVQAALDVANAALTVVNDAFNLATSIWEPIKQEYEAADDVTKVFLWLGYEAAQGVYDIAKGIYDAAYPGAVQAVADAQVAFDAVKANLNVDYSAGLKLSANLVGQVGLQIDFTADAGSIDTDLNYALTTETEYNQTSDALFILPTLVNNTTGDSVAFTTISPNVTFKASVVYDLGANLSLAANANIKALGATVLNESFTSPIPLEEKGSINVVDFDSTKAETIDVPFVESLTKGVLSVALEVPNVTTEGKESPYETKYFQEGGLVAVNFSEISDAIFNFVNAKIEINPELASTYNATIDGLLTSLWGSLTSGDQKPIFILDATDKTKSALFHVNTFPDIDTSSMTAPTLGFYVGYAKSNDFVKVNIDLDQLAALVGNVVVSSVVTQGAVIIPPIIINPIDQNFGLDDIFSFAGVSGAAADALKKFVDVSVEVAAADVDVSQNANFGQQFTLSVDNMDYAVTLEDNTEFSFAMNDNKGLMIDNASSHDANNDGNIDYSMKIVPKAMLSNDTELGLNLGYQLDFFKASLKASLGATEIELTAPIIDANLGPLLRVQGSMDQLAVDIFEDRFSIDVGSDTVEIVGIGYQDNTMFA